MIWTGPGGLIVSSWLFIPLVSVDDEEVDVVSTSQPLDITSWRQQTMHSDADYLTVSPTPYRTNIGSMEEDICNPLTQLAIIATGPQSPLLRNNQSLSEYQRLAWIHSTNKPAHFTLHTLLWLATRPVWHALAHLYDCKVVAYLYCVFWLSCWALIACLMHYFCLVCNTVHWLACHNILAQLHLMFTADNNSGTSAMIGLSLVYLRGHPYTSLLILWFFWVPGHRRRLMHRYTHTRSLLLGPPL